MSARFAVVEDGERLSALHAQAFPAPWSPEAFADLLRAPGVCAVLVEQGFAMVRTVAGEAELLTLAVAPAARRRGIGRALLDAALEAARLSGAEVLHLEVAAGNTAALALYAAAGFERSGLRPAYYASPGGAPEDAVLMRRTLNTPAASAYRGRDGAY